MDKRILIVTLSTTLLLLVMAGHIVVAKTQVKSDTKDMNSSIVTSYEANSLMIPPIDAAAPSTFETASFGLG